MFKRLVKILAALRGQKTGTQTGSVDRSKRVTNSRSNTMQVKDVAFGTQLVKFANDGSQYVRLNVSRRKVSRDRGVTVFANVNTGRMRLMAKTAQCTLVGTMKNASKAIVTA